MVRQADLKKDRFYKRAKQEGYRSRSAFKLLQIVRKFGVLKKGDVVVDLGAAPGGWSQVAAGVVGGGGRGRGRGVVVSVDLQPMEKIAGVVAVQSDLTNEDETVKVVKEVLLSRGKALVVDAVISDASPKLSGNRSYDQFRSLELSRSALKIASALLNPHGAEDQEGNFVAKIFQGAYYEQFYGAVKERFRFARSFSPSASRKRSAEIYVIGKGLKKTRKMEVGETR